MDIVLGEYERVVLKALSGWVTGTSDDDVCHSGLNSDVEHRISDTSQR